MTITEKLRAVRAADFADPEVREAICAEVVDFVGRRWRTADVSTATVRDEPDEDYPGSFNGLIVDGVLVTSAIGTRTMRLRRDVFGRWHQLRVY